VPLRVDKSTNILEVLKLVTRSNHLRVDSEPNAKVPRESVYDAEISIKTSPTCPRPDCKKEVESTVNSMSGSQNISDLMDISPSLFKDSPISPRKSVNEVTNREIINSYLDFGGGLYKRYKEYKKDNDKEASNALVFNDV
ncbi:6758_t:CDS:2, partial [Ambispora gerdemannii]